MPQVTVLSVPHALQGPNVSGFVDDPSYRELIRLLIARGVDFVFEEASGRGPSIAEEAANALLKPGHYLDVDPARNERSKHGIKEDVTDPWFIRPCDASDVCEGSKVDEQRKREELWLRRIQEQNFEKGLLVCGVAHNLSIAFRLRCAGIVVAEACSFIPHDSLCRRLHK